MRPLCCRSIRRQGQSAEKRSLFQAVVGEQGGTFNHMAETDSPLERSNRDRGIQRRDGSRSTSTDATGSPQAPDHLEDNAPALTACRNALIHAVWQVRREVPRNCLDLHTGETNHGHYKPSKLLIPPGANEAHDRNGRSVHHADPLYDRDSQQ